MKQWLNTADEYIKSWKIRDVNQNVGLNVDLTGDAEASKEMLQEERGAVIPVIYHHWRGSSPFLLFS